EELIYDDETLAGTAREGINVASGRVVVPDDVTALLGALVDYARAGEAEATPGLIRSIVPEFHAPGDNAETGRA
ncbi:MAG: hypothetical protein HN577_01440, partial [Rhodospirillaceae bacterium]|nr:hypothetical protein [Rhodospirillaceae bacterium]